MKNLPDNLRYLRDHKKLYQRELADKLMIARGRYAKYEEGVAEPPLEILLRIAGFYHVSIDLLISADLQRIPQDQIQQLESVIEKFRQQK